MVQESLSITRIAPQSGLYKKDFINQKFGRTAHTGEPINISKCVITTNLSVVFSRRSFSVGGSDAVWRPASPPLGNVVCDYGAWRLLGDGR